MVAIAFETVLCSQIGVLTRLILIIKYRDGTLFFEDLGNANV